MIDQGLCQVLADLSVPANGSHTLTNFKMCATEFRSCAFCITPAI